jgi:hypothetical protein
MVMHFRFEVGTSDENEAVEAKSSLEMRQERLRVRLDQLEEQALAEKPWQLKGEVSASARPQNSLLEEVVEFDLTTRPGEKMRSTYQSSSLQKHTAMLWVGYLVISLLIYTEHTFFFFFFFFFSDGKIANI